MALTIALIPTTQQWYTHKAASPGILVSMATNTKQSQDYLFELFYFPLDFGSKKFLTWLQTVLQLSNVVRTQNSVGIKMNAWL